MKIIDARNQACPLPVICAKEAMEQEKSVQVIVDNEIAKENLEKLATQKHYHFSFTQKDHLFEVVLSKEESVEEVPTTSLSNGKLLVVDKDKIGQGDEELGIKLMENYFFALSKAENLPAVIQFYHHGVKLCHRDSKILNELKELEAKGVKIYICGLCIDYFGIKDEMGIGEVTNMYSIVETQMAMKEVIHL